MVSLEAFAAGASEIGSNQGGIAERVSHEGNGLLVETRIVALWIGVFHKIAPDS